MSSDQVDISTYIDNIVVDAIRVASNDATTKTDDVKENEPDSDSKQPCSHFDEEDVTEQDTDGNVDNDDNFKDFNTEDVKVKMEHEDHGMFSCPDSELTLCNEQDLWQQSSNAVDKHHRLVKQSLFTNVCSSKSTCLLPDFDQICDADCSEESVLDDEPLSCEANNVSYSITSQIPYFEKCYTHDCNSIPQTESNISETVTMSGLEDKSLRELMQEIRDDLSVVGDMTKPETDLGLETLFEDQHVTDEPHKPLLTKTKSAKKRKKQQLRLKKLTNPSESSANRRKFAQTFDELKKSSIEFEDHNLDSSITCSVCLELYHLPSICQPCGHMFCDLCLRRLTALSTEGIPCPLCRTVISSCELNRDFDENLLLNYPDIYTARAMSERHSKYRHQLLPYTPPVPLGRRLMRQLIAHRNSQSDLRWMSHDSFKFLLGCTVGMFLASLVMLYSRVTSVNDARDVNVVFLSVLLGATVTYLVFKFVRI